MEKERQQIIEEAFRVFSLRNEWTEMDIAIGREDTENYLKNGRLILDFLEMRLPYWRQRKYQ